MDVDPAAALFFGGDQTEVSEFFSELAFEVSDLVEGLEDLALEGVGLLLLEDLHVLVLGFGMGDGVAVVRVEAKPDVLDARDALREDEFF